MSSPSKHPLAFDEQTSFSPRWIRKPAENQKRQLDLPDSLAKDEVGGVAGVNAWSPVAPEPADIIPAPPSLDPVLMLEMAPGATAWPALRILARLVGAVLLAGAVAYLVVMRNAATTSTGSTSDPNAELQSPAAIARLAVTPSASPLPSNQPLSVVGWVSGAGADASLVIDGLLTGAKLLGGRPSGPDTWRVAVADLREAAIVPPSDFVGAMDLRVELQVSGGTIVDRRNVRLEWLAKPLAARPQKTVSYLDTREAARLLKQGQVLLMNGEVAAARLVFERLVDAGEPRAAVALGETYERGVLQKVGVQGIAPDLAKARAWYEKAKELGSIEGQRHLEMLAGSTR
jgi:hypothetical protein